MNSSSTFISVSVQFESGNKIGDISGGNVFCMALSGRSAPLSVGDVKSAAYGGSTSRGSSIAVPAGQSYPLTLSLTITDLDAVTEYFVYCYAETAGGIGNTLEDVLRTAHRASTVCCNAVSFINAPRHIPNDASLYKISNPLSFVFKYALSVMPRQDLTVTHVVSFNGVTSTDVLAVPSSMTFNSTSLPGGQFVLYSNANSSGSFVVSLVLSGRNAQQYFNISTPFILRSPSSAIPAPQMTSSRFSDSGQVVMVRFSAPTDKGGMTSPVWNCSDLFEFKSASKSICTWLNSTTISISFPPVKDSTSISPYLIINSLITLKPGQVKALCTSTVAACKSYPTSNQTTSVTLKPINPSIPTVIVQSPFSLGKCANLTLDPTSSYGGGGRPYNSSVWTVTGVLNDPAKTSVNTAALTLYLNSLSAKYQTHRPITVDRNTLVTATYTFSLSLTSFLGMTSSKSVQVAVLDSDKAPAVTIVGPSFRTIGGASSLTLLSSASLNYCVPGAKPVKYVWTVREGDALTAITSASFDPARLTVPARTLTVGSTYTVTVTATADSVSSSASVQVYITSGSVIATIAGGSDVQAHVGSDLALDASGSSDENSTPVNPSVLSYKVSDGLYVHASGLSYNSCLSNTHHTTTCIY